MKSGKNNREFMFLKIYSVFLTILVVIIFVRVLKGDLGETPEIIRVKGIIVEDSNGRERILIGAPAPYASNRVRTDTNKVKELWGSLFPPQYLNWYKEYNHDNYGILILDSLGYDRIAIGNPAPDPNIGKRIGPSTGVIINDQDGFERTGYGILNVDGENRVVLGLDNENGTEGVAIAILEDGTSGISLGSDLGSVFLGKADTASFYTKKAPFIGLLLRDSAGNDIGSNTYINN